MSSLLLTGILVCMPPAGAVVFGADASLAGTWVYDAKDPNLIADSYMFKADGTGSCRFGETDVVWTFRWTRSGDDVTIKQDAGAKLTIKAKLLEGGKRLRIYSVSNSAVFTDYRRK